MFCLFFFTRHIRGFEKMLEAKWQFNGETGHGWHYSAAAGADDLFSKPTPQTQILEKALEAMLAAGECVTNAAIYRETLVQGFLPTHRINDLRKVPAAVRFLSCEPLIGPLRKMNLKGIDWVIVGGESGASPRPMKEEWATSIRDQCEKHDVAFFFKQWGGRNKKAAGRELEGAHYDTFPKPKKRRQMKLLAK